jgi:hypothetical protein
LQKKKTREKTTTEATDEESKEGGNSKATLLLWQFKGHTSRKTNTYCLAIQRPKTYNCQLRPAKEGACSTHEP